MESDILYFCRCFLDSFQLFRNYLTLTKPILVIEGSNSIFIQISAGQPEYLQMEVLAQFSLAVGELYS